MDTKVGTGGGYVSYPLVYPGGNYIEWIHIYIKFLYFLGVMYPLFFSHLCFLGKSGYESPPEGVDTKPPSRRGVEVDTYPPCKG